MNGYFNPIDYGAAWDGATDDTAALNAAAAAARAANGVLKLPPGTGCYIAGQFNTTGHGSGSWAIEGTGSAWGSSTLKVIAAAGWSHALDLSGFKGGRLENFTLTTAPGVVAWSGLFPANAAGQGGMDMLVARNLYVSGNFHAGALYPVDTASGAFYDCKFYNYNSSSGGPAAFFSAGNGWQAESNHQQVLNDTHLVGDLAFFACEFHDFSGNPGSPGALLLDGCVNIPMFKPVISQRVGGNQLILCVNNPRECMFYSPAIYVDEGPQYRYTFACPSGHTATDVRRDNKMGRGSLGETQGPFN